MICCRTGAWLIFMIGGIAAATFAPKADAAQTDLPNIEYEKYKLPNGLEVILSEDHRLPVVAVNIWYHVGPANEEPGRTGFAHLFEHMMFQGSKHVPANAHFGFLERAGASSMNGTTDYDRTNYFETVPSNQLELTLWLESDRMGYLIDRLDQANLSNQQDVVRNERRQSVENRPYGIVEETLIHQLFPASHPYHADVIGSHADIQAAKLDDVRAFFLRYYVPDNASMAIVGDFDKSRTKALVEKYFGPLKPGGAIPPVKAAVPQITAERRVVVKDRIELPRVYMGWVAPPIYKGGDAEGEMAAFILGGLESSRLYKKLVYELQIAQDVGAWLEPLQLGSVFRLFATARSGHTPQELEQAIDGELERFRREGPTEEELEGARNAIETHILERLETVGGVADRLNYYNHYLGNPGYLPDDLARYRKITTDQIRAFAQQQLQSTARVIVEGVPGKPDLAADVPKDKAEASASSDGLAGQTAAGAGASNADEPWRGQPPAPGAGGLLQLPTPKTFTLANGLTVLYTGVSRLPLISARLVIRAGSDSAPIDKPGLASFTAAMLEQGTPTRNALQIAAEATRLGTNLEIDSSADAAAVGVHSLAGNFSNALALVADVALHPSFPPAEIARLRARRLSQIVQQKGNASAVADRVTMAVLYGAEHPYGNPEIGTEASLNAMDREDLLAFWKKTFAPGNAALVVAGDIQFDELKALGEKLFGEWKPVSATPAPIGTPGPSAMRIVLVDKPGAPQTQLRVAMVGFPRSTPDYPSLEEMNAILGGLFSSRLNLNLREQKGYTYGIHSGFVYRRGPGPFMIRSGVRTDITAAAIQEVIGELRRISESPITPEELKLAKESQLLSLPGRFESTMQIVSSSSNLFVYGLGADYYARLPVQLSDVSLDDVRAAARKYIAPEKMVIVAVGDRAKIEPAIAKLGIAPIEVRDAEGSVIKP